MSCTRLTERVRRTTPVTPAVLYPNSPDDLGAPCGLIGRSFLAGSAREAKILVAAPPTPMPRPQTLDLPHSIITFIEDSRGGTIVQCHASGSLSDPQASKLVYSFVTTGQSERFTALANELMATYVQKQAQREG